MLATTAEKVSTAEYQEANKAFIDIGLRPGIATPPEDDRVTATRDLHKNS